MEIAHEALLREWQRLRGWLDESRGDVRMQRVLGSAAAEWLKANHNPSFLLHGSRLEQFEGWATETSLALTGEERLFLEASLAEGNRSGLRRKPARGEKPPWSGASAAFLRALVVVLLLATLGSLALAWKRAQANSLCRGHAQARSFWQRTIAEAEAEGRATQQALAEAEADTRATAEAVAVQEKDKAQQQADLATSRAGRDVDQ